MTKDADEPPESPANVVGIRAKPAGIQLDELHKRYPAEWMACCADVLTQYRAYLKEKSGLKRFGWEPVRNIIMREFDKYNGDRITIEDVRLRRQDLEHWLDRNSEIGAEKFRFVDYFIRKHSIDDDSDVAAVSSKIVGYLEGVQCDALRTLYLGERRIPPPEACELAKHFVGDLYVQRPAFSDGKNPVGFALYVKPSSEARFPVIAMYFSASERNWDRVLRESYKCFGCFVPAMKHDEEYVVTGYGEPSIALPRERAHGVLKLFDRGLLFTRSIFFHFSANCGLEKAGSRQSIILRRIETGIVDTVSPEDCAYMPSIGIDDIRAAMTATSEEDYELAAEGSANFKQVQLSDVQRSYLNSLQDEYLLW